MSAARDHGGGLDAAVARYGGDRADWIDLSTGINPVPYPVADLPPGAWTGLPDTGAMDRLLAAARAYWSVPDSATVIAAPGASALIARMPDLTPHAGAYIPGPTYNEHAAAFAARGRLGDPADPANPIHVYVHPNNPDGRLWPADAIGSRPLTIVDESFCDVAPAASHVARTGAPGVVVLKSFGKFWGLAGLRLGFAIGRPDTLAPLTDLLGPWPVSGPALEIGTRALGDTVWADTARHRLAQDSRSLDAAASAAGARVIGGTDLFRLYEVSHAGAARAHLVHHHIWSRIFPYSANWLRLGLPAPDQMDRVTAALATAPLSEPAG